MDKREPEPVAIEEEFSVCPECGYEDGFHTSFKRLNKEECKIILICPSCHSRFDPGWVVEA